MVSAEEAATILQAMRLRRTSRDYEDRDVPRHVLEDMVEAARWAPNHRHTEPWRIFVLDRSGDKRKEIADLVAQWTFDSIKNPAPGRRENSAEAARQEILDAPSFIYVYSVPGPTEEVTTENYAATCCAVQNMQLAAYAHGVAVGWSTGKPTKPERLADVLGADPDWTIVGALYVGYPKTVPHIERRSPAEFARWY